MVLQQNRPSADSRDKPDAVLLDQKSPNMSVRSGVRLASASKRGSGRIGTGDVHEREMTDVYAAEFPSSCSNGDCGCEACHGACAFGWDDSEQDAQRRIVPNFSRVWTHPAFPWFEPPAFGPGPITNLSRWPEQRPQTEGGSAALPASKVGVSNYDQLVGDHKSPILQPWAAEVVKRFGEMSLAGITFPNPSNQC